MSSGVVNSTGDEVVAFCVTAFSGWDIVALDGEAKVGVSFGLDLVIGCLLAVDGFLFLSICFLESEGLDTTFTFSTLSTNDGSFVVGKGAEMPFSDVDSDNFVFSVTLDFLDGLGLMFLFTSRDCFVETIFFFCSF